MDIGAKLRAWGAENTQLAFTLLRAIKPNLSVGDVGIITRFNDVQEALSRPAVFGVTYAEKMAAITDGSNFFLGMNPSANYTRDVSNMRILFRREDVSTHIEPLTEQIGTQLLCKHNLKRAEGTAGRTMYEGPFPRHLTVTFDH